MGGGGGGGNDGVDYQREQEEQRQARIRQGMGQIDNIFNGVDVYGPTTAKRVYSDPYNGTAAGTYYDANGNPLTFTNQNQARNKRGVVDVRTPEMGLIDTPGELYYTNPLEGRTVTHQGGFDDSYYNKRSQAYQDFALPQLQDQYKDQQKSLTYALSRGGNLGSSLAAAKTAELDKDYSLQQQNVYDTGQDYANKARAAVAEQKGNLVSLLQASADPDAVASMAQSQAANLSAMPNFSPLSPVISNVASGLGSYLTNQQTADAVKKAYSDTYSNSLNRTSGKVG